MLRSFARLLTFAIAVFLSNLLITFVLLAFFNHSQAPLGACLKTPIDYEILDLEKWQVR